MQLLSSCGEMLSTLAQVSSMNLQLEYGSDKGNAEASEEECRKFYCESCAFVSRELEGEVLPVCGS